MIGSHTKLSAVFIFRSHTWDFLRIEKVVWSVLPSQTLTLLAMISVVALSSSLDIAAIEIELKRPLDYNHEASLFRFRVTLL